MDVKNLPVLEGAAVRLRPIADADTDLIVKWRENTNFAAGGEDDVAVVVHAGERALGEEDDLLGLQTEVVVIAIEWGEGSVKWTHRIYFSVSACVIGLVIT